MQEDAARAQRAVQKSREGIKRSAAANAKARLALDAATKVLHCSHYPDILVQSGGREGKYDRDLTGSAWQGGGTGAGKRRLETGRLGASGVWIFCASPGLRAAGQYFSVHCPMHAIQYFMDARAQELVALQSAEAHRHKETERRSLKLAQAQEKLRKMQVSVQLYW